MMVTDCLMRRHENRRGTMVTDSADREGIEFRKPVQRADDFDRPASHKVTDIMASRLSPPGIVSRFEPDIESLR